MEPLSLDTITRLQDTLLVDMQAFLPELILCGGIILLLLIRLFKSATCSRIGTGTDGHPPVAPSA